MSDKAVGLAFLAIGAFLVAAEHLAEAIFRSGDLPTNAVVFHHLEDTGVFILVLAFLSAALGSLFFILGVRKDQDLGDGR